MLTSTRFDAVTSVYSSSWRLIRKWRGLEGTRMAAWLKITSPQPCCASSR